MPRAIASRALALVWSRTQSSCNPSLQNGNITASALFLRWSHIGRDRPPFSANHSSPSPLPLPGPPRNPRFLYPPSSDTTPSFGPVEKLLLQHCGSISLQELLDFARLPDADRSQFWHGVLKRSAQQRSPRIDQAPYLHEPNETVQEHALAYTIHALAEEAGVQQGRHRRHAFWSALAIAMEATHFQQIATAQAEEVLALTLALHECGVRQAGVWRACLSRIASCRPAPTLEDLLAVIEGANLAGVPCPPEAAGALTNRMCQQTVPASHTPPAATYTSVSNVEDDMSMAWDPFHSLHTRHGALSADVSSSCVAPDGLVGLQGEALQRFGLQPGTLAEQGEAGRMGGAGSSKAAAWAEGLADCYVGHTAHNQQQQQQLPHQGVAPHDGALLTEEFAGSVAVPGAGLSGNSPWEGWKLGEGYGSCGAHDLEAGPEASNPLALGLPQAFNPAVIPDVLLARIAHAAGFCAQSVMARGGNLGGTHAAKAGAKADGSEADGAENGFCAQSVAAQGGDWGGAHAAKAGSKADGSEADGAENGFCAQSVTAQGGNLGGAHASKTGAKADGSEANGAENGFCARSVAAQGGNLGGTHAAKAGAKVGCTAGAGKAAAHGSGVVPGMEGVGPSSWGNVIGQKQWNSGSSSSNTLGECHWPTAVEQLQQQQQQQQQYPRADLQEPVATTIGTACNTFHLWPAAAAAPPQPPPPQQQHAAGMATYASARTASANCMSTSNRNPHVFGVEDGAAPVSPAAAEVFLPACQLLWARLPGMFDVRSLLQVALAATAVPGRSGRGAQELAAAACARVGVLMQGQLTETSAALPAALHLAAQRARWHALSRRRLMDKADANPGIGSVAVHIVNGGAASGKAPNTRALHLRDSAHSAPSQRELMEHTSLALLSSGRWLPQRQGQRRLGQWQRLILQLQQLEHQLHMQLQQQQQHQHQQWRRQQDLTRSSSELPDPHSQQQVQSAQAQQARQEHHPPSNYWASTLSSEGLGTDWSSCVGAVSTGGAATCEPTAVPAAASTATHPAESNHPGHHLWDTTHNAHQQQLLQLLHALQSLRDAVLLQGSQSDAADSATQPASPAVQEVQASILQALQVQLEQAAVDLGPCMLLLPSCKSLDDSVHEPLPGRGSGEVSKMQHHRGDLGHAAPEALPELGPAGASERMQLQRGDLGLTSTEAPLWEVLTGEHHQGMRLQRSTKGKSGSRGRDAAESPLGKVSVGKHTTIEAPLGGVSARELLRVWEVLGDVYYPPAWVVRPELADVWLQAARAAMVAGMADVDEICRIVHIATELPPSPAFSKTRFAHDHHPPQTPSSPQGNQDQHLQQHQHQHQHQQHPPQTLVSPQAFQDQHQRQQHHHHHQQLPPQTPVSPQASQDQHQQQQQHHHHQLPPQTPVSSQASRDQHHHHQQQQQQQQHSALIPALSSSLQVPLSQQLQLLEAAAAALHHQPHPPSASCSQLATLASAAWAVRKAHALHRTHPSSSTSTNFFNPPFHHMDTSQCASQTEALDSFPSCKPTSPSSVSAHESSSATPVLHSPLASRGPSLPSPATNTSFLAESDRTLKHASLHLTRPLWPPIPLQLRALIGWMEEAAGALLGSARQRRAASQSLFAGRSSPRADATITAPAPPLLFHQPQGSTAREGSRHVLAAPSALADIRMEVGQGLGAIKGNWATGAQGSGLSGAVAPPSKSVEQQQQQQQQQQGTLAPGEMVRQLGLPAVAALLSLTCSSSSSGGGSSSGVGSGGGGGRGLEGTHAGLPTVAFWAPTLSAAAALEVVRMHRAWVAQSSSLHARQLASPLVPAPLGLDTIIDLAAILRGKRVDLALQDWACAHLRAAHHAAVVNKVLGLPWQHLQQPQQQHPQDSQQLRQCWPQASLCFSHDTPESVSFQGHASRHEEADLFESANSPFLPQVKQFHPWPQPPQSASAAAGATAAAAAETPCHSFTQLRSPVKDGALSLSPSSVHSNGQFSSRPSSPESPSPHNPSTTIAAAGHPDQRAQLQAARALNCAALQVEALLAGWPVGVKLHQGLVDAICAAAAAPVVHVVTAVGLARQAKRLKLCKGTKVPWPATKPILALQATVHRRVCKLWGRADKLGGSHMSSRQTQHALEATQQLTKAQLQRLLLGLPELGLTVPLLLRAAVEHRWSPSATSTAAPAAPAPKAAPKAASAPPAPPPAPPAAAAASAAAAQHTPPAHSSSYPHLWKPSLAHTENQCAYAAAPSVTATTQPHTPPLRSDRLEQPSLADHRLPPTAQNSLLQRSSNTATRHPPMLLNSHLQSVCSDALQTPAPGDHLDQIMTGSNRHSPTQSRVHSQPSFATSYHEPTICTDPEPQSATSAQPPILGSFSEQQVMGTHSVSPLATTHTQSLTLCNKSHTAEPPISRFAPDVWQPNRQHVVHGGLKYSLTGLASALGSASGEAHVSETGMPSTWLLEKVPERPSSLLHSQSHSPSILRIKVGGASHTDYEKLVSTGTGSAAAANYESMVSNGTGAGFGDGNGNAAAVSYENIISNGNSNGHFNGNAASASCVDMVSMHKADFSRELRHDHVGVQSQRASDCAQCGTGGEANRWRNRVQFQEPLQQHHHHHHNQHYYQQHAPPERATVPPPPPPGSPTLVHQAHRQQQLPLQQQLSHLLGRPAGAHAPNEHKLPSHNEWVSLLQGILLQLKPPQPTPRTARTQPPSTQVGRARGPLGESGDDARTHVPPRRRGGWAQGGDVAGSVAQGGAAKGGAKEGSVAKGSAAKGSAAQANNSFQQTSVPQATAPGPQFVGVILQGLQPVLGRLSTNTLIQVLELVSQLAPCPPDPISPVSASSSSSSSKAVQGEHVGRRRQRQQHHQSQQQQQQQHIEQAQQLDQQQQLDEQQEQQQQLQVGQQLIVEELKKGSIEQLRMGSVEQLWRGSGPQGTVKSQGPAGPKAPATYRPKYFQPYGAGTIDTIVPSLYASFYATAAAVAVRNLRTKLGHLQRQRAACTSARAATRLSSKYGQVARLATYAACSLRQANSKSHEDLLFLMVELVVQEQAFDALPIEVAAMAEWALCAPHFACAGCPHYSATLTVLRSKLALKSHGISRF